MICQSCKDAADRPQQSLHRRCLWPKSCTCQHRRISKERRRALAARRAQDLLVRHRIAPILDLRARNG